MTYKTLLVHLQTGQSNAALLSVAGEFADRFEAHLIGIAACQPMMIVSGDGTVCGDVYANDQRQITTDLETLQAEFRNALQGSSTCLEWRSEITITATSSYLAAQARCADLILTGTMSPDAFDGARAANAGTLAMQTGRPVLIVPTEAGPAMFGDVLIGWKDTRECRRATSEALPLLKEAGRVTVLEIAAIDDLDAAQSRVEDVVVWLERHGVMADCRVERSTGHDAAQLRAAAHAMNADVVVAGAYGHGRLREWVIGGVTRDLLIRCDRCVLVSH